MATTGCFQQWARRPFRVKCLANFPLTLTDDDVRGLALQFGWQDEWNQARMSKRAKAKASQVLSHDVGQMLSGHLAQLPQVGQVPQVSQVPQAQQGQPAQSRQPPVVMPRDPVRPQMPPPHPAQHQFVQQHGDAPASSSTTDYESNDPSAAAVCSPSAATAFHDAPSAASSTNAYDGSSSGSCSDSSDPWVFEQVSPWDP